MKDTVTYELNVCCYLMFLLLSRPTHNTLCSCDTSHTGTHIQTHNNLIYEKSNTFLFFSVFVCVGDFFVAFAIFFLCQFLFYFFDTFCDAEDEKRGKISNFLWVFKSYWNLFLGEILFIFLMFEEGFCDCF